MVLRVRSKPKGQSELETSPIYLIGRIAHKVILAVYVHGQGP